MKKPDDEQKLTPYFLALSQAEQYDLTAATRGPDVSVFARDLVFSLAKTLITNRIRWIVFGPTISERLPMIPRELRAITSIEIQALNESFKPGIKRELWEGGDHYFQHLIDAIRASADHPLWGNQADALIDLLTK